MEKKVTKIGKEKNRKLLVGFLLVFLFIEVCEIGKISGAGNIVEIDYSFLENKSIEKSIDFSSFVLKVRTTKEAVCKFSTSEKKYSEMEESFEGSGRFHEKLFIDIGDGIHNFYVKCVENENNLSEEPPLTGLKLKVSTPISAHISLSKEGILRAGRVEVNVVTSKIPLFTPELSYSFDNLVYNPIVLFGSGKNWRGYLIIPENAGETVLSFKFKAYDLEGRVGEEITSGKVFLVDTLKPRQVSYFNAVGYEGKIKLEWKFDEEVKEFNIYRSTSPGVDYTDFYTTVDGNSFYDSAVEKGKTYYYRIAAVDEAGNEGGLSMEVKATPLFENESIAGSEGLDIELRGYVDSFLGEVDYVKTELERIKTSFEGAAEKEKKLFLDLKLSQELDNSEKELNALRRDVEQYKLQRLEKEELDRKLSSARVKLNIIKKKIPESLSILEEENKEEVIEEEAIREVLAETKPSLSDSEIEKSIRESLKLVEESNLKVKSNFYIIEIVYFDGSKRKIGVVSRDINAVLERNENGFFAEVVPKEIVEKASDIEVKISNYKVLKEDPILSFDLDTKKILYVIEDFEGRFNAESLRETKLVPIYIYKEEESQGLFSKITGYFAFKSEEYLGIGGGIIVVVVLLVYFLYLKKTRSPRFFRINRKIEEAYEYLEKEDMDKVKETYNSIKKNYEKLKKREKSKIFKDIELLHQMILIKEIETKLKEVKLTKDKEVFEKLKKIFEKLPDKLKEEIEDLFEEVENEIEKT